MIDGIQEESTTYSFQGEEPCRAMQGHTGKHQGRPEPRREGELGPEAPLWFLRLGPGEAGSALVGLSHSSEPWAIRYLWLSTTWQEI